MTSAPPVPTPKIRAEMLKGIGLFGGLDDESLRVLSAELPVETVEPGVDIVTEGDLRQELFIVIGESSRSSRRAATANSASRSLALGMRSGR